MTPNPVRTYDMVDLSEMIDVKPEVEDDPKFEDINGSGWIIGVDHAGLLFIVDPPAVHDSFFENGLGAPDVGFPKELLGTDAGLYWVTVTCVYSRDWESGHIDDYHLEPLTWKRIL